MKNYLLKVRKQDGTIGKIIVGVSNDKDIPKIRHFENLNVDNIIQKVLILNVKSI